MTLIAAPADYLLPSFAGSRKNGDPGEFSFELKKDKNMWAQITFEKDNALPFAGCIRANAYKSMKYK